MVPATNRAKTGSPPAESGYLYTLSKNLGVATVRCFLVCPAEAPLQNPVHLFESLRRIQINDENADINLPMNAAAISNAPIHAARYSPLAVFNICRFKSVAALSNSAASDGSLAVTV